MRLWRSPDAPIVFGDLPRPAEAFQSRSEVLRQIREVFGRSGTGILLALPGSRGIGKTQVAAAYARERVAAGDQMVSWINSDSERTLLAGLDGLAARLGFSDRISNPEPSGMLVRRFLETAERNCLVVFDNVEDPEVLRPWLPGFGRTKVLITTTRRDINALGGSVTVTVHPFTPQEASAYLRERTGLEDEAGAAAVALELGYLPLGLAQAATVICGQALSYTTYLQKLRVVPVGQVTQRAAGEAYPLPLAAAISIALDQAEQRPPSGWCGPILELLAVLSADGIPRSYLREAVESSLLQAYARSPVSEDHLDEALHTLGVSSLISFSVDGHAVQVHRVVARVLRERLDQRGRVADLVGMASKVLLRRQLPPDQAWSHREGGNEWIRQVNALWENATAPTNTQSMSVSILSALLDMRTTAGRFLTDIHDHARAIPHLTALAHDRARLLGRHQPDTLRAWNNLAEAFESAGRLQDAVTLFERTLADREMMLGKDHPDTLTSRHNLAYAYVSVGRITDAIPIYERNLVDRERVLGSDHPDTLRSRNNLAYAYRSAGRLHEAIPLYQRTLADSERVLGPDHPGTLRSRNNLAYAYEAAGRLEEALRLLEHTLKDRERVLGAEHPHTLASRNNLAYGYILAGRLREAVLLLEDTLRDRERVLGIDRPDTLHSRSYLAHAYQLTGRLSQAISLLERTVADSRRVLGPYHPDTLAVQNSLAEAYQSDGRQSEAAALFERTLADSERTLGASHPHVLTARTGLDASRSTTDTNTSTSSARPHLRILHGIVRSRSTRPRHKPK